MGKQNKQSKKALGKRKAAPQGGNVRRVCIP